MNTTTDLLLHGWEIHPTVVAGCAGLLLWYFFTGTQSMRRSMCFIAGVLVLCLSLVSPLDPLGDTYLFSAHMVQHLLLILIVPPLLLLGLSLQRVSVWLLNPQVRQAASFLGNPVVAWCSNIGMMLAWHLPALYNAANASVAIHVTEHLCFLVTGCMFWWPVVTPMESERMHPGRAMLYLFGAAAVSTALGILITFLPVGHYEPYLNPPDELGALHLIRDQWGISAAEDQKLAGLLMWVPGCTIYFLAMLVELGRWFSQPAEDKQAMLAYIQTEQEVRHG